MPVKLLKMPEGSTKKKLQHNTAGLTHTICDSSRVAHPSLHNINEFMSSDHKMCWCEAYNASHHLIFITINMFT